MMTFTPDKIWLLQLPVILSDAAWQQAIYIKNCTEVEITERLNEVFQSIYHELRVSQSQNQNLTANGIDLPDVAGAVISGTAAGDWTLSCVRGQIVSMTFVFNDGRVRTLPAQQRPSRSPWAERRTGPECHLRSTARRPE
jgi:hypothetical protein